jgi:hypothetical protein
MLDSAATDALTSSSSRIRGFAQRLQDTERRARLRVRAFKKYADRFCVPTKLADLHAIKLKKDVKATLEEICNSDLGPDAPSRALSAQYFDPDGVLLFCYMGERWKSQSAAVPIDLSPISSSN